MESILSASESQISPENLIKLNQELLKIITTNSISSSAKEIKTIIESTIEFLLKDDQSGSIFKTFCKCNFIKEFTIVYKYKSVPINIQIIKSLSLLISNLPDQNTLLYWLSTELINTVVSTQDYDFTTKNDRIDFLSFYVNFLKSLSVKLDLTTLKYFFNTELNHFPLWDSVLLWYDIDDIMIQNVGRNIFLKIIKLKHKGINSYLTSLPQISYFILICKSFTKQVDVLLNEEKGKINEINEIWINEILFYQDIFSVENDEISYVLNNCIFSVIVVYWLNILTRNHSSSSSDKLIVYIIFELFYYIKNEVFSNALLILLFSEKIPNSVNHTIMNDTFNYEKHGARPKLLSKDDFQRLTFSEWVKFNFNSNFLKYFKWSARGEIEVIKGNLLTVWGDNRGETAKLCSEVKEVIWREEKEKIKKHHWIWSHWTGVNLGLIIGDERVVSFWDNIKTVVNCPTMTQNIIFDFIIMYFNNENSYCSLISIEMIWYMCLNKDNKPCFKNAENKLYKYCSPWWLSYLNILDKKNPKVNKENGFIDINAIDSDLLDDDVDVNNTEQGRLYKWTNESWDKNTIVSCGNDNLNSNSNSNSNKYIRLWLMIADKGPTIIGKCKLLIYISMHVLMWYDTQILQNHIEEIENLFWTTLQKIKSVILSKTEDIKFMKAVYGIFEEEYIWSTLDFEKLIITLVIQNPCFLSQNEKNLNGSYVLLHSTSDSIHKLRYWLWQYWLTKRWLGTIKGVSNKVCDKFPLELSGANIKVGIVFNKQIITSSTYWVGCRRKTKEKDDMNNPNFQVYWLFFNKNNICFAISSNINSYILKEEFPIREVDAYWDRKLSDLIHVIIKDKNVEIEMKIWNHQNKAKDVQREIYENKQNIVNWEYVLCNSYFSEEIENFKKN